MKIYYGLKQEMSGFVINNRVVPSTRISLVDSEYYENRIFFNPAKPHKIRKSLKQIQIQAGLKNVYKNCKNGTNKDLFLNSIKTGDKIFLVSKSKGKGFQGAIKAHKQKLHPASRSEFSRKPGATGTFGRSGKVKGTKGAKNLGNTNTYIATKILSIENNTINIQGSVAGSKKILVKLIVK